VKLKRRTVLVALAAILIAVLAVGFGLRELARSRTFQLFGRLVPRIETQQKIVALTFDDGPNTQYVDEILNNLSTRSVNATFFVTGAELSAAPDAGRMIAAAGHELGNHTWSHDHMILKSSGFYRKEIEDTDALIRATGQASEIYFRPPFCYKLVGLPWYLGKHNRTSITWDVEPDSYADVAATSQGILGHVVERVQPGSIILLHVWYKSRQTSREAVPLVIDALQGQGYRFVTVGEMLRASETSRLFGNRR
jgi:peptidoglycan-N-acetylglucosamine deacetylase